MLLISFHGRTMVRLISELKCTHSKKLIFLFLLCNCQGMLYSIQNKVYSINKQVMLPCIYIIIFCVFERLFYLIANISDSHQKPALFHSVSTQSTKSLIESYSPTEVESGSISKIWCFIVYLYLAQCVLYHGRTQSSV